MLGFTAQDFLSEYVYDHFRVKCSVRYLGTAIPSSNQRGIDSIQEPLSRRYPIKGADAVRGNKY